MEFQTPPYISETAVTYTQSIRGLCYCHPMLRVKPKLPDAKTRSCRFPDAMGGMDNGFSLCTAPAFCCSPGISNICRYMRILQVAGKL